MSETQLFLSFGQTLGIKYRTYVIYTYSKYTTNATKYANFLETYLVETNFRYIPSGHLLPYPGQHRSTAHLAELAKLTRLRKQTWIQLDSAMIQTRYRLEVVELHFQTSETVASIQAKLRHVSSEIKGGSSNASYNQFFLIAQSHTNASFYNITDYVERCLAWDLSVAERLRGRTLLYIYQTEEDVDDLLSDIGVQSFINRFLASYIALYGKDAIIGFAIELPHFLSVFDGKGSSIPWTNSLIKQFDTGNFTSEEKSTANHSDGFLPFLFYDTYNSSVIRSVFWQELTSQFARCFFGAVREFCHQHNIKFGVTVRESARSLQYELGTLLEQADCPILMSTESDTSRRFVVTKSVCSNARYPGISRKKTHTFSQCVQDASLGFNQWISNRIESSHSETYPYQYLAQLLQIGFPKRPILMVSPTQSLWMKPEEKQWVDITKAWGWLCQTVWNMGYDFDIVSEAQLTSASVEKKKRGICYDGKMYQLVLLPSCLSLHQTTVQILTEFTKAKGRLIANAPAPYLLHGKIGLEPYLLERLIYRPQTTILDGPQTEREINLKRYLRKWITPVISLFCPQEDSLAEGIQVHHRQNENFQVFYLFNTGLETIETLVEIIGEVENVEERHLQTAKEIPLTFWHANGKTYLNCTFEPEQGRLFVVSMNVPVSK